MLSSRSCQFNLLNPSFDMLHYLRFPALIAAIQILSPTIAFGHQGGGVPHIHPHGAEFLVIWAVLLIVLLPARLMRRK